jgi:hypothetical protein
MIGLCCRHHVHLDDVGAEPKCLYWWSRSLAHVFAHISVEVSGIYYPCHA